MQYTFYLKKEVNKKIIFFYYSSSSPLVLLQVEVAITLGKIVLNNTQTQKLLAEQTKFRVTELLHHLANKEETVRHKAGMALSLIHI